MTANASSGPAAGRVRTSLESRVPSAFTDEQLRQRARRQAASAWAQQRILVVSVEDDRLTWPERELVRQLGEKLCGQGGAR